jgi:trimeric autotransporter adhesin
MAYTKYSLTPADNNAAPPNGAPEGMLPSAVNDTMRDMMSQIRDVGDGIRGGTYTMTAPVITGGSISGATGSFSTLAASGVATFSAGTVSAPAITTTGDTNTGIFFPAADTIAFTEGGAESMRINSSGQVVIGATSAPIGGVKFTVADAGEAIVLVQDLDQTNTYGTFSHNNGSTNFLSRNGSSFGNFIWYGSNGTNFPEWMRIDSAGNVGIGTASPSARLTSVSSVGTNSGTFTDNTNYTFEIKSGGAQVAYIGGQTGSALALASNGAERMRIDSAGNVGIGTASPSYALQITRSGASAYLANTDGTGTLLSGVNGSGLGVYGTFSNTAVAFFSNSAERMRIASNGKITASAGSNWVGTVSASGTSAVVERGSNANGGYVRFADGTQIVNCTEFTGYTAFTSVTQTLPISFLSSATSSVFSAVVPFGTFDFNYNVYHGTDVAVFTSSITNANNVVRTCVIGRWY